MPKMTGVERMMWASGPAFNPSDVKVMRGLKAHIASANRVAKRRRAELKAAGITLTFADAMKTLRANEKKAKGTPPSPARMTASRRRRRKP